MQTTKEVRIAKFFYLRLMISDWVERRLNQDAVEALIEVILTDKGWYGALWWDDEAGKFWLHLILTRNRLNKADKEVILEIKDGKRKAQTMKFGSPEYQEVIACLREVGRGLGKYVGREDWFQEPN